MKPTHKFETAAVLILLAVFIMSAFAVLALGVGVYQNLSAASAQGQDERLSLSYVWTKIKMGEESGRVYVGDFQGLPALYIDEELDGRVYRTAIYHHEGWIYELFYESGYDFSPRDGNPVVKNAAFLPELLDGGLIRITVGNESILLHPRTS